jgi:hypothetical protein
MSAIWPPRGRARNGGPAGSGVGSEGRGAVGPGGWVGVTRLCIAVSRWVWCLPHDLDEFPDDPDLGLVRRSQHDRVVGRVQRFEDDPRVPPPSVGVGSLLAGVDLEGVLPTGLGVADPGVPDQELPALARPGGWLAEVSDALTH